MNRKAPFLAPLVIFYVAVPVRAQRTVNPNSWIQQDGLTVASSQEVTTRPTKLRLFATLTARDEDARRAVTSLAEKKKTARDKLQSLGVKPIEVRMSPSRILEWNSTTDDWWWYRLRYAMRVPGEQPSSYTAYAAVQVDWEIKEQTGDDLILMPIDLVGRIRDAGVFGAARADRAQSDPDDPAREIYMLFVGDISEEAGTDATKRAYEEANAQAMKLAATTQRTLGKLATMSPRVEGTSFWLWDCEYATRYAFESRENRVIPNPMSEFTHLPSEVFSADPADLHRTYSIELRFELN
jgi:hypothetical protein